MNLKLLASSVILVTSWDSLEDALTLLLPVFDLFGRLSVLTFTYTHEQRYITFKS